MPICRCCHKPFSLEEYYDDELKSDNDLCPDCYYSGNESAEDDDDPDFEDNDNELRDEDGEINQDDEDAATIREFLRNGPPVEGEELEDAESDEEFDEEDYERFAEEDDE